MPKPKLGLVVEGGGMRGAHTCGVLMALAERGLTHFDVIAANSAGACTVAYMVSGQFEKFHLIWGDYLHDGRFLDLKRLLTKKSVMDLDYLVDNVFRHQQPLDLDAVRNSPTRFFIATTDVLTGHAHYFENHHPDILSCLKASAAMPVAYRKPVMIDRRRYLDGGIADPIPIQKVLDAGCTDIIVVLTRPDGYRKPINRFDPIAAFWKRKSPALAEAMKQRGARYNDTLEKLENGGFPANVTVIRPSQKTPTSRLTTQRKKILQSIALGIKDAHAVLDRLTLPPHFFRLSERLPSP